MAGINDFRAISVRAGFLSAVADRFGLWGAAGTNNVAWGNFNACTPNLRVLAPYFPAGLLDVAAGGATLAEIALGVALLRDVALRWTAQASAATLVVFAAAYDFGRRPARTRRRGRRLRRTAQRLDRSWLLRAATSAAADGVLGRRPVGQFLRQRATVTDGRPRGNAP
jgi:hypothetical protein